ncbi:MAG: hypothetical protein JSW12_12140 [Deltaproteobacteria bacterium]|nr:MAG: hypothetical protein JSW12_12140 [Deltaproteobacteria bacterium]
MTNLNRLMSHGRLFTGNDSYALKAADAVNLSTGFEHYDHLKSITLLCVLG